MIGDDQGDMFDAANNPTFAVYTGDEPLWGRSARDPYDVAPAERTRLVFRQHARLARHLLQGLIERGFDVANLGGFEPRGNPARGVSHMVSNLVPEVDPELQIPMYNAGWIDQPLDRWILERLQRNDIAALEHLFTFDSDTLRSGTGEVRAWITVAAAMRRPATVVDYVPAHCTQTGCGFVYWPAA
jgi:protocatechuate 4,5-dioxygenase beta chain